MIAAGLLLVAIMFVVISTWKADMTYWDLLWVTMVLITGLSLAITPGTNIMMALVLLNRSGIGSAMNDTTRQLGSAVGVAVFGSIISSGYLSRISAVTCGLDGMIKEGVETALAFALNVVGTMGAHR